MIYNPPKRRAPKESNMDIALFEPDIAQNTGTLLRLGACMDVAIHIIEPCGFPFSAKAMRRAAMDYAEHVELHHHIDWDHFKIWCDDNSKRLILLTTKGASALPEFKFEDNDILLLGRESAGVPDYIHDLSKGRVYIPMAKGMRSLNVAMAGAMVLSEALRQTTSFPKG